MKSNNVIALLLAAVLAGCGGGGGGGNGGTPAAPTPTPGTPNELVVTVSGDKSTGYVNKPTVSVTICNQANSSCQTVDNILLDTGSYGLRVFRNGVSNGLTSLLDSLPQQQVGSAPVAECVQFADGSSSWGPVRVASVVLGAEPAVQVPIHVMDAGFGNPAVCGTPDTGPEAAGFNGILGVGVFARDCGAGCENNTDNGMYYTCTGASCTGMKVPQSSQVQNPVTALTTDFNGVVVDLTQSTTQAAVPESGSGTVYGKLLLGIGTRSNNIPESVTTFGVTASGQFPTFSTTINAVDGSAVTPQTFSSFLDTGSNGIFIPSNAGVVTSSLPICNPLTDWFCPPATRTFSATNSSAEGKAGATNSPFTFQIANAQTLFSNPNAVVFNDLGGPSPPGSELDFGLPFFLGRKVFVGVSGTSSSLGTGPYWAY